MRGKKTLLMNAKWIRPTNAGTNRWALSYHLDLDLSARRHSSRGDSLPPSAAEIQTEGHQQQVEKMHQHIISLPIILFANTNHGPLRPLRPHSSSGVHPRRGPPLGIRAVRGATRHRPPAREREGAAGTVRTGTRGGAGRCRRVGGVDWAVVECVGDERGQDRGERRWEGCDRRCRVGKDYKDAVQGYALPPFDTGLSLILDVRTRPIPR